MSADTATLSTCLAKMWVITHETSLQTYGHFGAIAQRLEWWENCIGKRQEKGIVDYDRNNIRYYR